MTGPIEARKAKFRSEFGAALIVVITPPLCALGFYFMGRTGGCSGGECGGALMMVMMLAVVAVLISAGGAAVALILLLREFWARLADHYTARASTRSGSGGIDD